MITIWLTNGIVEHEFEPEKDADTIRRLLTEEGYREGRLEEEGSAKPRKFKGDKGAQG